MKALDRYYDEGATFEGMRGLMKRAKFSNAGTLVPGEDEFYPFTDNNVPPRPSWQDFANDPDAVAPNKAFAAQYNDQIFVKRQRGTFFSNWITAHSAVIDMERGMLDITVWEEWDDPHRFWLNGAPGSEANPWAVGAEGHETEVTAWTNGTGTLVIEGVGAVGRAPWKESAAGITKLQFAEGVTNLGETMATLPALASINGLTLDKFVEAGMVGAVKATGFSAIAIKGGEAKHDIVIERSDSLGESAEWKSVSTNEIVVPAPGEQGFFIVAPATVVPGREAETR